MNQFEQFLSVKTRIFGNFLGLLEKHFVKSTYLVTYFVSKKSYFHEYHKFREFFVILTIVFLLFPLSQCGNYGNSLSLSLSFIFSIIFVKPLLSRNFDKNERIPVISTLRCGNYGNSLTCIFGKNFVKVTTLLNS